MIYLQNFGISTALAAKIYQKYGSKVYEILETNPYKLADDIEGVGFKTADEIAAKIGIHTDSDFRIQSGIFYVLQQSMTEGHVYLPKNVLEVRTSRLLGVEIEGIEKYIMDLCMERKTVMKEIEGEVRIYPSRFYYMELNVARMLNDLDIDCAMPEDMMEKRLRKSGGAGTDFTGSNATSGGDRIDQAWTFDPDRRTRNRKDNNNQHHDSVF